MRFLRIIEGKTRRDIIRNKVFRRTLKMELVELKIEKRRLGWLGRIHRKGEDRLPRQVYEARPTGKNKRGRPRNSGNSSRKKHRVENGPQLNPR
ncbi:hypothetical protein ILUMI_25660 [Ignelater luminosus]|uniref:Uncharacterized protein n=1 Tax=Ignelater luminosus TaxID=2038154 RepID=A0A8K0CA17_IGNLU|nr:hypothetical protein ILUMI_25660 [Ignelater luminosus]